MKHREKKGYARGIQDILINTTFKTGWQCPCIIICRPIGIKKIDRAFKATPFIKRPFYSPHMISAGTDDVFCETSSQQLFKNNLIPKNMFVLSRNVSASYRVIATLVATALLMWAMGASHFAQAANITNVYDLLSDSAPSAASNHTIEFVSPTGVGNGEDIVIAFETGTFDLTGIGQEDIDLLVNGANVQAADWSVVTGADDITITINTGSIAADATTTILIGDHATNEGTPDTQIVNPAPAGGNQSYEIDISAGTSDSGHTRVVILDTVEVTANVQTTFSFTVAGVATSTAINGTSTTITSSSTTIPFGTLSAGEIETLAQDLAVTTNAIQGFVVTIEEDQHLLSSTGADIDNFVDSVTSDTPAAWASPQDNIANENTWGHWGITSEDTDTTRTNEFGSNTWAGVSTTPQVVFSHDGPADGTTAGEGSTSIGFQVEISPLQEAADDYSTTLTYIATPTF